MSTEENYLDDLIKSGGEPELDKELDASQLDEILLEELGALEELPIIEDIPGLENLPVMEEMLKLEELPIMEEILELEELPVMEEIPELEELPVMEEIPELEELPMMEEIPEFKESIVMDEVPELGELPIMEEISNLEELSSIDDITKLDDGAQEPILQEIAVEDFMSEEMNLDELFGDDSSNLLKELNLDDSTVTDLDIPDEINLDELESVMGKMAEDSSANEIQEIDLSAISDGMDDDLSDILSVLDSEGDSELMEISNMLKKSDNNEPIEDDMMELLTQMADDDVDMTKFDSEDEEGEASLADLFGFDSDEDDQEPVISEKDVSKSVAENKDTKNKKKSKKSKSSTQEKVSDEGRNKPQGFWGKLFNMLTEDIVPEPTEEELEAEKEAKAAKKQENLTKKQEEKVAKAEAKKKSDEEKVLAKAAKAEAAAQKKQEKQAAKEAKKAAKLEKEKAEPKPKKIPAKKIVAVSLFAASVFAAIIISTDILSEQGYLQKARKAFYDNDYQTVYLSTYGMELNESDALLQARSKVILRLQRKYDSYQTNLKMGREIEALNSLIEGISVYDSVNLEAEQYGVVSEIDAIKTDILNVLNAKYGVDETKARELLSNTDSISYTKELIDIVKNNI